MYKLVYKIAKNHTAAVISAIYYITAPYHLTDLYTRIAIAELASFMFLPITFIGMYELFKESKKTYNIAIGAIGLILTHNVIAVYTAIFCFIYMLVNYKKLNNKIIIKSIIINIVLILLCTSFYWVPLLEHYFGATYEVFIPERMFKNATLIGSKLSILDLFITKPWNMNFHIGLPIVFGIILAFIYINKIEKRYKKEVTIFLIFGLSSIIMSLKIFPFEYVPNILKMLQFVWRMMEFSVFFLSIVSGIVIAKFINGDDKKKMLLTSIFMIYLVVLVISVKRTTKIPFNEKNYLEPIPLENMTTSIHPGCATFEYLPKKAYENFNYLKTRPQNALIIEGKANIVNENKNGIHFKFEIQNVEEKVTIELPYIYYLGYTAKLTDASEKNKYLEIKESDNGFCMIELYENGTIEVSYTGTIAMKITYGLTLIGVVTLIYLKKVTNRDKK